MGLLSGLFKKQQDDEDDWDVEPVTFNPFLTDEITTAYWSLMNGSWAEASSLGSRPDAWMLAGLLAGSSSKVPVRTFEQWAVAEPSAATYAILGLARTRDAWAIRGHAYARDVDPNAWTAFNAGLEEAESALWYGVELDPFSADPWVGLLPTARGLGLGLEETRARFNEAHKLAPFRLDACEHMLQATAAKWFGSHEAMFDFARWVDSNAPVDSAARSVLAFAHIERMFAEGFDDPELQAEPGFYLTQPEVSAEMNRAARSYLDATSATAEVAHLRPLNYYSVAVKPCDNESALLTRELFSRIGDRPTEMPWSYYADEIGYRFAVVRQFRLSEADRMAD